MKRSRVRKTAGVFATAALASGVVLMLGPTTPMRPAHARPIYAQETGLPCGRCHVNPNGGGPRTGFGRAFATNGHRLPGGHRYGSRAGPLYGRTGGNYGYHGGMMGDYGPDGGMGPGMMGGYGPGMMGW
jgi:hypothetical protein